MKTIDPIDIVVNGEKRNVGKVIENEAGERFFYRPYKSTTARMRCMDSFGFDANVADWLKERYKIAEVHFDDLSTGEFYTVPFDKFLTGIRKDHGERTQIYLPVSMWTKFETRPYNKPNFQPGATLVP